MNLPKVVTDLIDAQNSHDAEAYSTCFAEMAVVVDEGNTYTGRVEIRDWIQKANEENQTVLKPVEYVDGNNDSVLTAQISGTFPGSPAILNFHLRYQNGLIDSLNITS